MPHSVFSKIKVAISRLSHREIYLPELVGYASQHLSENVSNAQLKSLLYEQGLRLRKISADRRLLKYFDGQRFDFKGVLLPDIRSNDLLFVGLSHNYNDLFKIHREMYYSELVGYVSQQLSENVSNPYLKNILYDQGLRLRKKNANRRLLKYFDGQRFDLNGVFLPDIRSNDLLFVGLSHNYNDLFKIHCEKSGDYSYKIVDPLDRRISEGTYFYIGPNYEKIELKPGDIVIDAGAWIGDFSALAANLVGKTGKVYAFEPSEQVMKWLKITASYYPNLIPIAYGLGNVNQKLFYHDDEGGGGKFVDSDENGDSMMEITRLDDWVLENQIPRIDFIKADIEGFERKMLMGAKRVLSEFGPILSLCTYHLPDDPKVLKEIILEINPNYKIIQRRNKLFAFIPRTDF